MLLSLEFEFSCMSLLNLSQSVSYRSNVDCQIKAIKTRRMFQKANLQVNTAFKSFMPYIHKYPGMSLYVNYSNLVPDFISCWFMNMQMCREAKLTKWCSFHFQSCFCHLHHNLTFLFIIARGHRRVNHSTRGILILIFWSSGKHSNFEGRVNMKLLICLCLDPESFIWNFTKTALLLLCVVSCSALCLHIAAKLWRQVRHTAINKLSLAWRKVKTASVFSLIYLRWLCEGYGCCSFSITLWK